jgi:hypothetical protein
MNSKRRKLVDVKDLKVHEKQDKEFDKIHQNLTVLFKMNWDLILSGLIELLAASDYDDIYLLQLLDLETLSQIRKDLSIDHRNKLALSFEKTAKKNLMNLKKILFFINRLTLKSLSPKENEIRNLINQSSIESIIDFCHSHSDYAAQLFSILSNQMASELVSKVDTVFLERMMAGNHQVDDNFFNNVKPYFQGKKEEPFIVNNLRHSISLLGHEQEEVTFRALKTRGENKLIEELAASNFPVFLINQLPDYETKTICETIPVEIIINFLSALEVEIQGEWIRKILPTENKRKDLILSELDHKEKPASASQEDQFKVKFFSIIKKELTENTYKEVKSDIISKFLEKEEL